MLYNILKAKHTLLGMNKSPRPAEKQPNQQHHSEKNNRLNNRRTNESERRKQTILFLLNQERIYEHQRYQTLISYLQNLKGQNPSSKRFKNQSNLRNKKFQIPVVNKKIIVSQSKLPSLNIKRKRDGLQFQQKLAPWEHRISSDLVQTYSSRFAHY